eukprot:14889433-Alexandrium_andersonii.AAC.1
MANGNDQRTERALARWALSAGGQAGDAARCTQPHATPRATPRAAATPARGRKGFGALEEPPARPYR